MATKPPPRTEVHYRSAVDGRFTTQRVAERSPNQHVREVTKVPPSPPPRKGK